MSTMNNKVKIDRIAGTGIALESNDIDTDRIIPARFLKKLSFNDLGKNVFHDERKQAQSNNQVHPFDELLREGARVLVVAKNFGCGSSREHAPQALKRWGIDAVVGESFGEIFRGNCASIGLACLTVNEEDAMTFRNFVKKYPRETIAIDLTTNSIRYGDTTIHFDLSEAVRERFVSGCWNIVTELVSHGEDTRLIFEKLPYATAQWSEA